MEEQIIDDPVIKWASKQACLLLPQLGNRWLHVQGVVKQAKWVSKMFDKDDQKVLIAAAYLHDIGYTPQLQKTGFHPIDGAYFLQSYKQERLASLVAYHSEAQFEAKLRKLETILEKFTQEHSAVADALTYCDLTTSPTGLQVSLKERIADILSRYKEVDIVTQATHQAIPSWTNDIKRTEQRLQEHSIIAS
jgi:HD domain